MSSIGTSISRSPRALHKLATLCTMLAASLFPVTGCSGTILPSEVVIVDVDSQESVTKVAGFIDDLLVAGGFARKGKDAYDELTQQDTVRYYEREAMVVSVALDQPGQVFIRASERSPAWSQGAETFVVELTGELNRQYPSKVYRE